jgi:radical SAM superfamily enzyme YgiQ (UPF0313 family)
LIFSQIPEKFGGKWVREGYKIVLTADRTLFTDYGGSGVSGFIVCLPKRLVPDFFLYRVLCPPLRSKGGRAVLAPYSLRKVEAYLLANGFDEREVVVAPPDDLKRVVGPNTRVIGVTTVDPMGYAPVSHTLCSIFGGGESCTAAEFKKLLGSDVIKKYRGGLRIIVGGPGVWQLERGNVEALGIDTLYIGDVGKPLVEVFRKALAGEKLPRIVYGEQSDLDGAPVIVNPARNGHVQVTRGCGRGCQFCTPTMKKWVCYPKPSILEEVKVNAGAGLRHIGLLTDDGLRYGARGLEINREAVLDLFRSVLAVEGVSATSLAHVSFPTIVQAPDLVHDISELCGYSEKEPWVGPQIGLETGSPRLIEKYMIGKPKPFSPKDWPEVVVQASQILNDNYWYPCTTLIIGLPDEREDDVLKTLELVDRLKDSKQWLFPLFFVAMGGCALEKEETFTLGRLTRAHWDLLFACWEHSIRFSKRYSHHLFTFGNKLTKSVTKAFIERGIAIAEKNIQEVKRNPEIMIEGLKTVQINSLRDILKYV